MDTPPPSYENTLISQSFTDGPLNFPFTVHGTAEKPLFRATEIGAILGIAKIRNSLNNIDDEDKVALKTGTRGGEQQAIFLTEQGMYQVVMLSRKPIAKKFRKFASGLVESKRLELYQVFEKQALESATLFKQLLEQKNTEIAVLKKTKEIAARLLGRRIKREALRNRALEHIYAYADNRGFYKIGKTIDEVKKRLKSQKTSLPELKLIGEYNCIDSDIIERCLKFVLHEHRIHPRHEFFDINIETLDRIIKEVIAFVDTYRILDKDKDEIVDRVNGLSIEDKESYIEDAETSEVDEEQENEEVEETSTSESAIEVAPSVKRKVTINITKENDTISKIIEFMKLDINENGIEYDVNEIRPVKMQEFFRHLRSHGFVSIPAADKLNEALKCLNVHLKRHKFCNKCQVVVKEYGIKCCPSFQQKDRSNFVRIRHQKIDIQYNTDKLKIRENCDNLDVAFLHCNIDYFR